MNPSKSARPDPVGASTIRRELLEKMGLSYADTIKACRAVTQQLRSHEAARFGIGQSKRPPEERETRDGCTYGMGGDWQCFFYADWQERVYRVSPPPPFCPGCGQECK